MYSVKSTIDRHYLQLAFLLPLVILGLLVVNTSSCSSNKEVVTPVFDVVNKLEIDTGELLNADSELSLFVAALNKTELSETIGKTDSILVLAPTNLALREEGSAFLLEGAALSDEDETQLLKQLQQHIVENPRLPTNFGEQPVPTISMRSLAGKHITIRGLSTRIVLGRDTFVTKIVNTSNGTILYIDGLVWSRYAVG